MTTQEFKKAFIEQTNVFYEGKEYRPFGMQTIIRKREIINSVAIQTLNGMTTYWVNVGKVQGELNE